MNPSCTNQEEARSKWLDDLAVLGGSLRDSSLNVPVGSLPSRERWNLLTSVLMGHQRVHGNLRPRDLPLDPQRGMLADLLSRLHNAAIPQIEQLLDCRTKRFGSWLLMAMVLEKAGEFVKPETSAIEQEKAYSQACWLLLKVTAAALASMRRLSVDGYMKMGAGILCDNAGINLQQTRGDLRKSAATELMCSAANLANSKRGAMGPFRHQLRWLTIKTVDVQTLMRGCKKAYIMRGLSIWCSQVLGYSRDLVEDWSRRTSSSTSRLFLVTDTDALARWLIVGDEDPVGLARRMHIYLKGEFEANGGMSFIEEYCPRIVPWAVEAQARNVNLLAALPALSAHVSEGFSLADLFKSGSRNEDDSWESRETAAGRFIKMFEADTSQQTDDSCQCVAGAYGAFKIAPSWWEERHEKFGWQALVWGHAGAMQRLYQQDCLRLRLNRPLAEQWLHHGDLISMLKKFGLREVRLALVKMDGDNVGRMFVRRAPVRRLALSLGIAAQFDRMLFAGFKLADTKAHSLMNGIGVEQARFPIPIDIQYMGGDDHLYCLPHILVSDFLKGMNEAGAVKCNRYSIARIAVVVIVVPLMPSNRAVAGDLSAKLVSPGMKLAKGRGDPVPFTDEIRSLCKARKMVPTIRPLDSSMLGEGSPFLHGIEIELNETHDQADA